MNVFSGFWKVSRLAGLVLSGGVTLYAMPVQASEATTYTYDAQGRLKEVQTTGGPNDNLNIKYQLDRNGNRVTYVVTGSQNRGLKVVVVPLNGYTVIPLAD